MTTGQMFGLLGGLLAMSAFFSGSETALMRMSPFRIKALARKGHLGARLADKLLERPDRLIGLILAGNNAVNVAASALTTIIALRIGGQSAVAIGGGLLLLFVLIFSELAPKTVAALYPEKIALPAAIVYYPLMFVCYPLVWAVNLIANGLLLLIGIRVQGNVATSLSRDELHAVVSDPGTLLPARRQAMLLRILDLEKVTVEDIMVPRSDIVAIDIEDDWDDIVSMIQTSQHTRLPVCRDGLDSVVGILHLRKIIKPFGSGELDLASLEAAIVPGYFVPEDTPLNKQLVNFQNARQRLALAVDEYGDVQGLVTLDDLLEEIVGEYTTDPMPANDIVDSSDDGVFVVRGAANIRALNRAMHWALPADGPKTLNGLILEYLETIPQPGTSFEIAGYPMTVLRIRNNSVHSVRIAPRPVAQETETG